MISSKECIVCHKNKKVSNYYIHRDNKSGHGLNNACKECDRKIATDLEGLKKYCEINSRQFNQILYDVATKTIKEKYKNDVEFNSLTEEKRESFLFEKIRNMYFGQQSQTQYYSFVKTDKSESINNIEEALEEELKNNADKNKEKKVYSKVWMGNYTKEQIAWLDAYYEDTCADFVVTNRNHKDYVRKTAKASLNMDEAFNDMMNGVSGADKRYKEAKAVFDTLSNSAKLSEKTRSTTDVAGLGSLSEVVAQLEQTGFLQKKMTFEKDDIDKISDDFRWTISSVGGEF